MKYYRMMKPILIVCWELPLGVMHREIADDTPGLRVDIRRFLRGTLWGAMYRGVRLTVLN